MGSKPCPTVKLTEAQRAMLANISTRKPVGGNDDEWRSLSDYRRQTIWALIRKGLLEARHAGPITRGAQMHRLTPAGRRALEEPSQ